MKRLLLIGLVGLSLVGCSNEVQQKEDLNIYVERAREQNKKQEQIKKQTEQWELDWEMENGELYGTKLAKYVVDNAYSMDDIAEMLKDYSSHSCGAYDCTTWNLGNNVTVTAQYHTNLGLQIVAKDGYTEIASKAYIK